MKRQLICFSVILFIIVIQYFYTLTGKQKTSLVSDSRWKSTEPEVKVILLAYMRSGSSFVGNILQSNPDVFYIFEPLYSLYQYYFRKTEYQRPLTFLQQPPRFLKDDDHKQIENLYLSQVLACKFINIDIETLIQVHWIRGITQPYYECLDANSTKSSANSTRLSDWRSVEDQKLAQRNNLVNCLHILYEKCQKRRVSLSKVIRYKMKNVESLLETNPQYKIIHLVRDPRAIIYSRHRIGYRKLQQTVFNQSKQLCSEMYDDVTEFEYLRSKYSSRMRLIRYEDLVANPVEEFQSLYKFINVSFGEEQEDYIHNLTTHKGRTCTYCVSNRKASETAHAWRFTINYDFAQIIDSNCLDVFGYLGYKTIKNKTNLLNKDFLLYNDKKYLPVFN